MTKGKASMLNASDLLVLCTMMTLALVVIAFNKSHGDMKLVNTGFYMSYRFFVKLTVMVIGLSLIAGQIQALYAVAQKDINLWLNGRYGVFWAYMLGLGLPGSVSTGSTLEQAWRNGALPKSVILTLVITSGMAGWIRVLIQVPLLGWTLTILVWGITIVVAAAISTLLAIFL